MKRSSPSSSSHAHIPAKLKYKRRKIEEFQQQQLLEQQQQQGNGATAAQQIQQQMHEGQHALLRQERVQEMSGYTSTQHTLPNVRQSSNEQQHASDAAPIPSSSTNGTLSNGSSIYTNRPPQILTKTGTASPKTSAPSLSIPKPQSVIRQSLQLSSLSNNESFLGNYNGYAYFCLDPTGSHISLPTNVIIDALVVSIEQQAIPQHQNPTSSSSQFNSPPSLFFILSRYQNYYYFLISNHDIILSTYRFNLEKQEMQQINIITQMMQDEQDQMDILKFLHLISSHGTVHLDKDPFPSPAQSMHEQHQFSTPTPRCSVSEEKPAPIPEESSTPSSASSTMTLNRRRCFLSQLCHENNPPQIDRLTVSQLAVLQSDIQQLFGTTPQVSSIIQQFIVNGYSHFNQERVYATQFKENMPTQQRKQISVPQSTPLFLNSNIFSSLENFSLSQKHALMLQYAQQSIHNTQKPIFSLRCLNQAYSDIVDRYRAALNESDSSAGDIAWQQIQNVLTCQIHYCQQLRSSGDLFNSLLTLYYLTLFFAYGHQWLSERDLKREKQLSQSVREFVAGYTFSIIPNVSPGFRTWWTLAMEELGAVPNSLIETRTASAAISHGWDNSTLQRVMNGKRSAFAKWKSMEPVSCGLMRIDMLIHQKEFKKAYYIASAIGETPKWLHLMTNKQRSHSATLILLQCEKNAKTLIDLSQMLHSQNFAQSLFVACRALQRAWKEHHECVTVPDTTERSKKKSKKCSTKSAKKTDTGSTQGNVKLPTQPNTHLEAATNFLSQVSKWFFEHFLKPLPLDSHSVLSSPFCSNVAHYLYPDRFDISDKELRPKLSDMYDRFRSQQEMFRPLLIGFMLKYVPSIELIQIGLECCACGKKIDALDILLWVYHTDGSLFSEKITDRLLNLASEFNKLPILLQPTPTAIQSNLYPPHENRQTSHVPTEAPIPFKWTKILYRTDIHLAHALGILSLLHISAKQHEDLDLPWFCQSVCLSLSRQHVLDLLYKIETLHIQLHPQVITNTANYIEETMEIQKSVHFLANILRNHIKLLHSHYPDLSRSMREDAFFSVLIFHLIKGAGKISFEVFFHILTEFLPTMLTIFDPSLGVCSFDGAVLRIMEDYKRQGQQAYVLAAAHIWIMRQNQELELIERAKLFEPSPTKVAICRIIFELRNTFNIAKIGDFDIEGMNMTISRAALIIYARECPSPESVKPVIELREKQIFFEKDFQDFFVYITQRPFVSEGIRRGIAEVLLAQSKLKEVVEYEAKLCISQVKEGRIESQLDTGFEVYSGSLLCYLIEETLEQSNKNRLPVQDVGAQLWKRLVFIISTIPWIPVTIAHSAATNNIAFDSFNRVLDSLEHNETYSRVNGSTSLEEFSSQVKLLKRLLKALQKIRGMPQRRLDGKIEPALADQINELRTLYEEASTKCTGEPPIVNQFQTHFNDWKMFHTISDSQLAQALKAE
uniref:Uncharacterized protein n=1 Tax=Percolomonas cosmopolitus TaxID=63605 RepID=A0A7S1KV48_9EUKA|mmetsp:Transcript_9836/g.36678  ORF Transcript_9836/g.36678 Transcript_9836/m.36678 type:complete len:1455 (+) Transcript_9836:284-4648(+)|eukprot:CAMPEP_0117440142 /NCGR_PEP_ID=MMETSP0759-20121206/2930_1 /TAXON_ID=63605 /ORGANISM="Percolomonas cosmopolitus, Strain WS" /LENGTH=1454 /DNA_ID=CAMNT_0005231883 /DNA_START=279 /DNA_END=4643 /DNA_ORIENTATION=+